ncbi:light-harvesting protein, partial [Rhodocyclus tenuis]|uniref:Light-harvesting protein n=2 Tax=Rhodocyclus TaxID=1064 RepID=A0A6L5JYI0_RHOTE|nr:light-harvesting antenna LH1, alpha subunit [Rhodocyclus gracilis]MQY52101.1 light-harvesting protein [Rhodocyclus gracilis]MRD72456.1 light-harvesting protein [Rhodocyclus gracilis]NJA89445.1 light-harvesting protein [Rhodocyclus gracilis]
MAAAQWKLWLVLDPRTVMIGTAVWLGVLALLIHFLLLGTERFNWIDTGPNPNKKVAALQVPATPAPASLVA